MTPADGYTMGGVEPVVGKVVPATAPARMQALPRGVLPGIRRATVLRRAAGHR